MRNRLLFYVLGFFLVFLEGLSAKILVLTHSYNRPDFIALQHETFKKFLLDEYEFVVFNDGPTKKLAQQIEEICRELQIRCIRVPQEIHQMAYLPRAAWEDWNSPFDLTDGDYITDSYDLENRRYLLKDEVLQMVSYDDALVRLVQAEPDDVQFFLHFAFLHYRRGGNYHHKSHIYHQKKTFLLDQFIEEIVSRIGK